MDITNALAPYMIDATTADLADALGSIDTHLEIVREAFEARDFVDLALAERVATVLRGLVERADDYTRRERSLLAAAIRYFVEIDDHSQDLHSPTGFEDDTHVLNAVCIYLGRKDLVIQT